MSLGLPVHVASRAVNAGIALGAHVVAAVVLGASLVASAVVWMVQPDPMTPVVCAGIAVLGALLAIVHRRPSITSAVLYLSIGTVVIALTAAVAAGYPPEIAHIGDYLVASLHVAVVMVGGSRGGAGRAVAFTVGGYLAGAIGTVAGATAANATPAVEPAPLLAVLLVSFIYLVTGWTRRTARTVQPDIQDAARDEKLAEVRSGVEARAAALLHDTILGSLAAINTDPVGPISPKLRERIQADLDTIVGEDWTERPVTVAGGDGEGPVSDALAEAASVGLELQVTGEPRQLSRLDDDVAYTLSLVLRQLLVNVRLHAGTTSAEVVLFGDERTVSLMVIDDGEGFDTGDVAPDRFGLRNSVQQRIEGAGGTVRIWSTRGRGTSVLVTVPAREPEESDGAGPRVMEGIR